MCVFDKFKRLCDEKGVAYTRALVEAGLSKSLFSKWQKKPETVPNGETLTKLSRYFNVPMDYFNNDYAGIKKQPTVADELNPILIKMLTDLTPAEVQKVVAFVEGLKANRKA